MWVMVLVAPRSPWIHSGSAAAALGHRVVVLPSNALSRPGDDVPVDEAVAGWFCERSVSVAALAVRVTVAMRPVAPVTAVASAARPSARPESLTVTPSLLVKLTDREDHLQPSMSMDMIGNQA